MLSRRARYWLSRTRHFLWLKRDLLGRALFCLAVGLTTLLFTKINRFDLRFDIRGEQTKTSAPVVVIEISDRYWLEIHGKNENILRSLKEIAPEAESFYWIPETWTRIIEKTLQYKASVVGINFSFSNKIINPFNQKTVSLFSHSRVFWTAQLDGEGRALLPFQSESINPRFGLNTVVKDADEVIRYFNSPLVQIPHLSILLANFYTKNNYKNQIFSGENRIINFQGKKKYTTVSLKQLLEHKLPENFFENKIVLIGSRDLASQRHITPIGEMNRSLVFANIIENILNNQWISNIDHWAYSLILIGLLFITITITLIYPQYVSFVFFLLIGTSLSAISLWIFDRFNLLIPIFPAITQLGATYIIFLSYQLSVKDYQNWQLEHEQRNLIEIEQFKNNFISLISHDLKTPIAKIQALCDHLLIKVTDEESVKDIQTLRQESTELNRYIRSILQVMRIETNKMQINREPTDFNELVTNVIRQIKPIANNKNINVCENLEPLFLTELDAVLIQEVILNLVENAIKYSPENTEIYISTSETEDEQIVFLVKDQGPGISPKDQKKVFEKFYRSKDNSMKAKGTGLGLYLVKYFIELHQGQVILNSIKSKGSEIGFSLPMSLEENSEIS